MFRWSLSTRAVSIAVMGLVMLAAAPAHAVSGTVVSVVSAANPAVGAQLSPVSDLLEPVSAISQPLPGAPTQALIQATGQLSAALGLPQDPTVAIQQAGLPPQIAGRVANLLQDLLACQTITAAHFAGVPAEGLAALVGNGTGVNPAVQPLLRSCAEDVWASTGELELTMAAAATCSPLGTPSLDIWPVLRLESGCDDNIYPNDYLLLIDNGGADTYRNNVGSNMVDLNFSPAGSAVTGLRGTGPARGCQRAIPGLTATDCVPTAAVLLDLQGNDTYGVKETPDHDTGCTTDLLVRRMMTGGAGFLGVGVLRDAGASTDTYTGKTGAIGAGHVFGVGILSDDGGDDNYTAVRNSQGFALVGGLGLLRDEAGNDDYGFYMPAPINPAAPNQTEGAGGVRDDEGEGLCDRIPRFTQGTANVLPGTIGVFVDGAGDDSYHGAFAGQFSGPFQNPSTRAGSLGFGNNQGLGVFLDGAGTDSYQVDGEPVVPGVPHRGNATTVNPGNDSTGAGVGAGIFIDQ